MSEYKTATTTKTTEAYRSQCFHLTEFSTLATTYTHTHLDVNKILCGYSIISMQIYDI